jgi:hypothetical protein
MWRADKYIQLKKLSKLRSKGQASVCCNMHLGCGKSGCARGLASGDLNRKLSTAVLTG